MLAIPEPPVLSAGIGLRLLRPELNRSVLEVLATGAMGLSALCAYLMLESDTTLREGLDGLEAVGTVRAAKGRTTSTTEYALTSAGEGFRTVLALTGAWLRMRPGRALNPESDAAWRAVAAFGDGWELTVLHHLLLRPSTRAELVRAVPALTRAKAKRMLRRLGGAGLIGPLDRQSATPRFALTEWACRGIAVLASIARWEREHLAGTAARMEAIDGGIALLASVPLVRLPGHTEGVCAFTVEVEPGGSSSRACAVWVQIDDGRVTACRSGASPAPPDAWLHGEVDAWLSAMVDARPTGLHLGGDKALARQLPGALHAALFKDPFRTA